MDVQAIKKQFPMFDANPKLVYLDSCATTLKPQCVLDAMDRYYATYGVNIHRGVYNLSYKATQAYEAARASIARFIHAQTNEIIITRNVTEALNKLCLMYADTLQPQDTILTTDLEHHSSILPWQQLAKRKNLSLQFIPLDVNGRITIENFSKALTDTTKIVAITYTSNVMGYTTPLKEIIAIAHAKNIVVIVDAAQAVPHQSINVVDLDCDFLAFSGHKMFGPTGIGVLYGKDHLLRQLRPIEYGGDMNEDVSRYDVAIKKSPYCFEAGTPPIAEAIGLSQAIAFIDSIGYDNIMHHEMELLDYAYQQLQDVVGITIYNKPADVGILTFNIDGVHPHDASTMFDEKQIALRAGHHCAQLVSQWLGVSGTLRASFHIYNDKSDVDLLVQTIKDVIAFFNQFNGASS